MTALNCVHALAGIACLALLTACATVKPHYAECSRGNDCRHEREESVVTLSDVRAKQDIRRVGTADNGLPIYLYRYKGEPTWRIGVMAQDVLRQTPDAVVAGEDGYYRVNYGRIAW